MSGSIRGQIRLAVVFLLAGLTLLLLLPVHLLGLLFAKWGWTGLAGRVPVLFHRILLKLFGVRLQVKGQLSSARPLLIVANHVSWLDIIVLGALAPLCFVAKAEMKSWPVFGTLAKLQRTVFIKRESRRTTNQQVNDIAERMAAREVMVLFPEGTTSDGNQLLPFKTPLFEAAKIALIDSHLQEAAVQPVALDYHKLDGLPIGLADRPHVAWPGEIGLAESLIPLVRHGALDVVVHVDTPIPLTPSSNRKQVAALAFKSIRTMLV